MGADPASMSPCEVLAAATALANDLPLIHPATGPGITVSREDRIGWAVCRIRTNSVMGLNSVL